ncbi:alternate-type signal peptide domain-containing protein [Arthrobacter sp. zg-Y411]|uniref:alternate-type signal peptide domain-containing protein n=1 Tax=Arthrobacter zhangbolii TaxID=2886936 RepID=UPI001D15B674|nr:alternate-type signal peptide domain-containing protein [Arthrobacter zhangbolii]MCC3295319.1 alternate-type signal peptide domain-containing protein [Arthrobacter zhangbolii]
MNKMAKGAMAIGVGAAMLLGGGGTLARWNATEAANAGTIVTGNLDVTAAKGVWTNTKGVVIANINDYRVVPGEALTFTQTLDVDLQGAEMKATLGLNKLPEGTSSNMSFSTPTLKQNGQPVNPMSLTQANDGEMTASTTFTFKDTAAGQQDVNTRIDLGDINYVLNQVAK